MKPKRLRWSEIPTRRFRCNMAKKIGFAPVFDKNSRVLILGSFPSVKSRQIDFYYGNKQNRFWKMICAYFNEEIPESVVGKKQFLYRNNIALWDMVMACEIEGSADASIQNAEIANLEEVLNIAKIEKILLNGTLAYELFEKSYGNIAIPYERLPSTSPANPRYTEEKWRNALDDVFRIR